MNKDLQQRFLDEAIRTGDQLLAKAEKSDNGTYWETMNMIGEGVGWQIAEGLYSGNAGIGLFFLHLHSQSRLVTLLFLSLYRVQP